ncbi:MAG: LysE family transporter [Anaerolineales bacterium]
MLVAFLHGMSFSVAPILSIGPFKIFVLSSALELGWRRTLILALTPLIADIPVILAIWLLLSQLPTGFVEMLKILGGGFYIYLAATLIRRALRPPEHVSQAGQVKHAFAQAILAIWITPNIYLNWSIVGVPALLSYADQSLAAAVTFLFGFYVVWILGLGLQIFLAGQAGQISAQAPKALVHAGSLLLASFGLLQIWDGLAAILRS